MILSGLKVIWEIVAERRRQDELWGGAAHDDQHNDEDWHQILDHYLSRVKFAARFTGNNREELVKLAAVAAAAIESYDRKHIAQK